jgi:iron complex transport system substrate-binding protein
VADGSLIATKVAPGGFPKALVDPLGKMATLPSPPQRIVSIALSGDELLLELVPPERLVGLTYLIDDPATTPSAPLAPAAAARVTEENPERLLSLQPSFVVTADYTRAEAIVLMEAAGIPVLDLGTLMNLDDVLRAIATLGNAVGEPARAEALEASLRARIQAVQDRPRPAHTPRVLLWESGYSYGRGTMQDDLIRRAGGVDAASEAGQHGPVALTEEAAVVFDPDVVVVPTEDLAPRGRDVSLLGTAPVWRVVRAVQQGRVYGIPRAWMGSVSHHAVKALEALADMMRDERAP